MEISFMADTSILDIGKFADPIKVLIEKAYDTGAGYLKPWQTKRVATAEAEAKMIAAMGEMDIEDKRLIRAMTRFSFQEMIKQDNIEAIAQKALLEFNENPQPEKVDPDWTLNFLDKCQLTSDEDMQTLWAKILAGEINTPGRFSKRTVTFVAEMDKKDAELFTKLCSFIWNIGIETPLLYEDTFEIYAKHGLDFNKIQHLADIGLVTLLVPGEARANVTEDTLLPVSYHKNLYRLKLSKTPSTSLGPIFGFNLGKLKLTRVGQELAPIANGQLVPEFLDHILTRWIKEQYFVMSDYPKSG